MPNHLYKDARRSGGRSSFFCRMGWTPMCLAFFCRILFLLPKCCAETLFFLSLTFLFVLLISSISSTASPPYAGMEKERGEGARERRGVSPSDASGKQRLTMHFQVHPINQSLLSPHPPGLLKWRKASSPSSPPPHTQTNSINPPSTQMVTYADAMQLEGVRQPDGTFELRSVTNSALNM